MLIPLATIEYWNTGTPYSFNFREGYTPMMDAIMTADLEIVKTLLPLTDLKSGICLHVAVRYGQLEIFKHLCGLFEDLKNLKDKKGRTIHKILLDKNYLYELMIWNQV